MTKTFYYIKQVLFYLFLAAYVFLLAKALLFKEVSMLDLFSRDRTIVRNLNLIPLKTVQEYFTNPNSNIWIALMNVVGNIALFVPLGLYLQIFKSDKKIVNSVILLCAISFCVEIVQYILGIGYTDIDDVILNTFGGLLGVLIYKIIYRLAKDEDKTRTVITFMFCICSLCVGITYFVLVNRLGYMIKIF